MLKEDSHPSDQDLLLSADGELSPRRSAKVRAHLAACWDCRARMADLERTIGDFVQAYHQRVEPELPSITGPRALLKAQLTKLAGEPRNGWRRQLRLALNPHGFAYVFALAIVVAAGALLVHKQVSDRKSSGPWSAYVRPLPNPYLTPGSTRPVRLAELCSTDHDEVIRAVPRDVQQQVFREYGIAGAPVSNYEVDYLITPGLGGTDDIRNLWPQPHYNTAWNSYVKDQLEDHLHQMVCAGNLNLATAQQDMATNWVSAYKKYFHTDKPLPNDSRSSASDTFQTRLNDDAPENEFVNRTLIAALRLRRTQAHKHCGFCVPQAGKSESGS
ncbi:MAG: zf-HC2 domain-containing protein [Candidatus Acidiferrales bacterium]